MKIKNWKKFQHFKDRRPPWIKLHREILEQRDIHAISDRAHRVLVGLWLLASDDELLQGNLPEIPDIAFKLRMTEGAIAESLQELTPWVDSTDIDVISPCQQVGPPEVETEAYEPEVETEREKKPPSPSADGAAPKVSAIEHEFNTEFWPACPYKIGKRNALKAYRKARKRTSKTEIVAALPAYKAQQEERRSKSPGDFSPCQPATWLNGDRWTDEEPAQTDEVTYVHHRPGLSPEALVAQQMRADRERET